MTLKSLTLLAGLLLTTFYTYAQNDDYAVTNDHDTIHGKIRDAGSMKWLMARGDRDIRLYEDDFLAYYVVAYNATYRTVTRSGKSHPEWMRSIVQGRINVYGKESKWSSLNAFMNNGSSSDDDGKRRITTWYMQKDSSELIEIKTADFSSKSRKQRKENLKEFFADNKEVSAAFEEADFTFDTLENLIYKYNQQYLDALEREKK